MCRLLARIRYDYSQEFVIVIKPFRTKHPYNPSDSQYAPTYIHIRHLSLNRLGQKLTIDL
jgi:hypothetical protein